MKTYVGCCGYCLARSKYYTVFNVVELQETFYDIPDIDKLKRYRYEAPESFAFSLKAWQAVTHPLDLPTWRKAKNVPDKSLSNRYGFLRPTKEVFEAWEKVVEAAEILNAKVVVIQTPPSFGYSEENYRNALEFFSTVDTDRFVIGWEPRGSWLQNLDKVADIVSRFKNVVEIVDPLKRLPTVVKSIAYFRLHGLGEHDVNYRYNYTDEDLERLSIIVKDLSSRNLEEIYIMFNNIYMAQNASRFKQLCIIS
ncbi:MAG: DUF72 domain-containing protein [Ignisphaera sp.]